MHDEMTRTEQNRTENAARTEGACGTTEGSREWEDKEVDDMTMGERIVHGRGAYRYRYGISTHACGERGKRCGVSESPVARVVEGT